MTTLSPSPPLLLPGLRAHMGDWVYYICFMKMKHIASRVKAAEEIHSSSTLQELLQRSLTNRSKSIAKYLIAQKERFFNALVVGTYGGHPKWTEIKIDSSKFKDQDLLEGPLEGSLGFLSLSGDETLFAIDGQHRVAGIRQAIDSTPTLSDEEVCVIVLAGVGQKQRDQDPAGFERTRRLFSTLNRYAKPVNKKDIIALDEDDVVAIITRRLVEDHPLFKGKKVSPKGSASIPPSDRTSFTTIVAIYDALDIYLESPTNWKEFKRFRPPDESIEHFYDESNKLWHYFMKYFKPLSDYSRSRTSDHLAHKYRHGKGGHLLFRPIGLLLIMKVLQRFMEDGISPPSFFRRLRNVPMEISSKPWVGLLWDKANRKIIPSPRNRAACEKLLYNSLGGSLTKYKMTSKELKIQIGGLLNRSPSDIDLPRYYIN